MHDFFILKNGQNAITHQLSWQRTSAEELLGRQTPTRHHLPHRYEIRGSDSQLHHQQHRPEPQPHPHQNHHYNTPAIAMVQYRAAWPIGLAGKRAGACRRGQVPRIGEPTPGSHMPGPTKTIRRGKGYGCGTLLPDVFHAWCPTIQPANPPATTHTAENPFPAKTHSTDLWDAHNPLPHRVPGVPGVLGVLGACKRLLPRLWHPVAAPCSAPAQAGIV